MAGVGSLRFGSCLPSGSELAIALQSGRRMVSRPASILFFAAVLVTAVPGTASSAVDPPRADEPPRGVVLSSAEAMDVFDECWIAAQEPHPEDFRGWEPSPADIAHLEALLPGFLHSQHTPPDFQPLHEYYRRYAGIIKNGKKTICVNFFHYTSIQEMIKGEIVGGKAMTPEDFLKGGFTVTDGGAYFFQTQFEVETDSFNLLSFNGYA